MAEVYKMTVVKLLNTNLRYSSVKPSVLLAALSQPAETFTRMNSDKLTSDSFCFCLF